jgi:hypothetical protein
MDVLRDAKVGRVERIGLADCEAALAVEGVLNPARSLLRLLRAVADRREQRPDRLHLVEQPRRRRSTSAIRFTGLSSTITGMSWLSDCDG